MNQFSGLILHSSIRNLFVFSLFILNNQNLYQSSLKDQKELFSQKQINFEAPNFKLILISYCPVKIEYQNVLLKSNIAVSLDALDHLTWV